MASRDNENNEGTVSDLSELPSCSYILDEAECSDAESEDESDGSVVVDLVDDAPVAQGDSLSLFAAQAVEEHELDILRLKRKFIKSPQQVQKECADLSPKLASCSLEESSNKRVRKALFQDDSGIEPSTLESTRTDSDSTLVESLPAAQPQQSQKDLETLFKSKNRGTYMLGRFKEFYGVAFSDITRPFKNDKTASNMWICALYYYVLDTEATAMQVLLKPQCSFVYLENIPGCLFLFLDFHVQKCRSTLFKWFQSNFNYNENRMLANPPRTRSPPAALYFIQRFQTRGAIREGDIPDFITDQCSVNQKEKPFELSQMVQWALDNGYTEEHLIALEYAMLAEIDGNAKAFLKANNQPKIVKDCSSMVRLYNQALLDKMTISQYLDKRCTECGDPVEDGWRVIVHFLRYQENEFLHFMHLMLDFLNHRPKKCTIVICGPSNTGKSYFATSLLTFLNGKVISFVNSTSQFWLSPLRGAKFAMIDDASLQFWRYADVYLRTLLDGNEVSLDAKHKNPLQVRAPPMLITTNEDIRNKDEFNYLRTRTAFLTFNKPFPMKADGTPLYKIDNITWTSFFRKFWRHLSLKNPEEEGDGEAVGTLRLYRGENSGSL